MTENLAVLIVGAGPTGLTLANDLARRNVPFKVIDAKPGPTLDSKGLALNISSQYGLKLIGLKDTVGPVGQGITRLNIHWQGHRFSSVNFSWLPTGITQLITQPQAVSENELLLGLERAGVVVNWNERLINVHESDGGVSALIEKPSGERYRQEFSYTVGCDGKYSVIRQSIQSEFSGVDYDMYFTLGDYQVRLPFNSHEVQYFVYPDTFFILVPIAEGRWRIVVKYDGEIPTNQPDDDEILRILTRYFGDEFSLPPSSWISRAPFYNRVASHISSRRCFIAGDAAHLFSPIGGTGMNTGIQDALNLGWKLALVYHRRSDEKLLKSYASERLPAIQVAADISDLSTQLITRRIEDHSVLDNLKPLFKNRHCHKNVLPFLHSGIAQKIAIENPIDDDLEHPCRGTYSRVLLSVIDYKQQEYLKKDSLWCFVNMDMAADKKIFDGLAHDLNAVIQHRCLQIILCCRNNASLRLKPAGDSNEWITLVHDCSDMPLVELVRPDGMVLQQQLRLDTAAIRHEVSEIFSTINCDEPEVRHYENVY